MKQLLLLVLGVSSLQAHARVGMGENKCNDGVKAIVHKIQGGTATSVTFVDHGKVIVNDGVSSIRDLNRLGCSRVEKQLETNTMYAEIPNDLDGRPTAQ